MEYERTGAAAHLPRSPACERNRDPILDVLKRVLPRRGTVLEIGAGTGQHAAHFARHLPHLTWLASDRPDNHPAIRAWIEHEDLPNLHGPVALEVTSGEWPGEAVAAVFSANTAHIMHWHEVEAMIAGVGRILEPEGCFCLYGPFRYGDIHTAKSNERFDAQLRGEDPGKGIRDRHEIESLADASGLALVEDVAMPANNRTLVFEKPRIVNAA